MSKESKKVANEALAEIKAAYRRQKQQEFLRMPKSEQQRYINYTDELKQKMNKYPDEADLVQDYVEKHYVPNNWNHDCTSSLVWKLAFEEPDSPCFDMNGPCKHGL